MQLRWAVVSGGGLKEWGGAGVGLRVLGGVRHSAPLLCEPRGAPVSPCSDSPAPLCDCIHLHGTHPGVLTEARTLPGVPPLLLEPHYPPLHLSLAWFSVPNCTLWAASSLCRHPAGPGH